MDLPELRYRNCPTVEAGLMIDASPQVVWALVSDIQLPARFSSEFRGAEWLDGATGPRVGARFIGHNYHPAIGEWETTSTICEYEPGRLLGWAVGGLGHPSARWRFILTPEGGGTRLVQWMQMGRPEAASTSPSRRCPIRNQRSSIVALPNIEPI